MIINEFSGIEFECPSLPNVCAFPTGQTILEYYGMTSAMSSTWIDIGLLLAITLMCRLLAFICLVYMRKPGGA